MIWITVIFLFLYSTFLYFKLRDDIKIRNTKLTDEEIIVMEKVILDLKPREFEEFIANLFRYMGYESILTQETADGGKDVIVKGYKNNPRTYVECKQYRYSTVGREIIQKLIGACTLNNINHAIVVTTGNYTKTAKDCLIQCNWIELWNMNDIINIISDMTERDVYRNFNIIFEDDETNIIET